jgi:hypothetical protein
MAASIFDTLLWMSVSKPTMPASHWVSAATLKPTTAATAATAPWFDTDFALCDWITGR